MRHHQKWRQDAGEGPPERRAEGLPAPAQRRRELLGQVNSGGGEGRQYGEAGDQSAPATITPVAYCSARCDINIKKRPGSDPASAQAIVQRRPMISIRISVKPFPGMLAKYTRELNPKLKVTAVP